MDNLWQKVENIVAKGEIARFVQFLFCHYVFKKLSAAQATESVYMRERVNPYPHTDTFWRLCSRQLFENIVAKEEIAQN